MAAKITIELNDEGIQALLKGAEVQAAVASRIGAAMSAVGGTDAGYKSEVYVGRDRVRGQIWTATGEAMQDEAENRTLTRAIDKLR